jgi:ABC-type branched-subunit amino acid transport system substrate-binding protein
MSTDLNRRDLLAATAATVLPGLASRSQATGEDILVGQIGPFTGTPVPGAPEINQGLKAALGQVNAAGGINGRGLTLFELDDGFKEESFLRRFAEAMALRPVALLSPMGTGAVQRMLSEHLLDQNDIVVLNAVPGAESLRSPGHPRLFHIRAGDRQQVERIVRHAVTLGVTQMAALYQDLSIGASGLAIAQQVAIELGMTFAAFMAPSEGPALTVAAKSAAESQAQSVLVLGSPRFAAEGIAALRQAGYGRTVYALSYVSPALVKRLAEGGARGVALAQVFPSPNGSKTQLQLGFQGAMKRLGAPGPYTAFQLEGYVTGRVLAEGLRQAKDVTPASLAKSLRAMGDFNLGGFNVNFARDNVGSRFVDIAMINGEGRLVY